MKGLVEGFLWKSSQPIHTPRQSPFVFGKQMTISILPLVDRFRQIFSAPTFENFRYLLLSWLMNPHHGWLSNCLRAFLHMPDLYPTQRGKPKHFSAFYRFFTRAKWDLDSLGELLARALEHRLDGSLNVIVDDTLCRRSGPMILGAGIHHDPLRTTRTDGKSRRSFSFGLQFVILAVWVPVSFVHARGIAVPVLFRLYRSKKRCPAEQYRTRTELAAELLQIACRWWPDRPMVISVDHEYACKTVLSVLDDNQELVGPMRLDAALYQPYQPEYAGFGRPPIWGERLDSPQQLADDESIKWEECQLVMYGQRVTLLVKTQQARWKSAGKDRVLTVIVTRDPTGTYDDACLFRTRADATAQQVLTPFCRRWTLEVTIRDGKQLLHLEQIQNGFVHRDKPTVTHRKKRPGPQAPTDAQPVASERTVPFFMLGFGFVVDWYLAHGDPERELRWARFLAPWWRHKTSISFNDMLQAFRRQMEQEHLWTNPPNQGFDEKYLKQMPFQWPGQENAEAMAA